MVVKNGDLPESVKSQLKEIKDKQQRHLGLAIFLNWLFSKNQKRNQRLNIQQQVNYRNIHLGKLV